MWFCERCLRSWWTFKDFEALFWNQYLLFFEVEWFFKILANYLSIKMTLFDSSFYFLWSLFKTKVKLFDRDIVFSLALFYQNLDHTLLKSHNNKLKTTSSIKLVVTLPKIKALPKPTPTFAPFIKLCNLLLKYKYT